MDSHDTAFTAWIFPIVVDCNKGIFNMIIVPCPRCEVEGGGTVFCFCIGNRLQCLFCGIPSIRVFCTMDVFIDKARKNDISFWKRDISVFVFDDPVIIDGTDGVTENRQVCFFDSGSFDIDIRIQYSIDFFHYLFYSCLIILAC